MTNQTSNTPDSLREQIVLLLGNALYSGKSLAQISKITKKELEPFETATDQIIQLIEAHEAAAIAAARVDELKRLRKQDRYTNRDSYAQMRIHELENKDV